MALPKGIRYDSDKVQKSPENVQEKIMSMYYDASRDYEKVLARFVKVRKEIADVVNSVAEKEPELASILEDRYMNGYKIEKIAAAMHYEESTIHRKMKRAYREAASFIVQY